MKLEKRMIALLVGASGLLVVILAVPSRRALLEPAAPAPAQPAVGGSTGMDAVKDSALVLEQHRRAEQLTWVRDPFAPASARTSARSPTTETAAVLGELLPTPTLTGISICGEDRRAVVDRRVVQQGDQLTSGYTVGEITARSVTLSRDQAELVLRLGEEP